MTVPAHTLPTPTTIGATVVSLVDHLQSLGWAATADPDMVTTLAATNGQVAFVDLPTIAGHTQGGRLLLTFPVHLCAVPNQIPRLWALIPDTIASLSPQEPITPQTLAMGDVSLPGYRLTTTRRITC